MTVERPTSPHVTIYSWLISNTLSILHRLTGFGLSFGTILLVVWLVSAAYYPAFYYDLQDFMGSIIGRLLLVGWTFAFFYHLANGIRHLFWDIGKGFELGQAQASGIAVVAFTIVMTGASWWYATKVSPVPDALKLHSPVESHSSQQGLSDSYYDSPTNEAAPHGQEVH